jgi:cysteinyl-tRNA synthetase
MQKVFWVASVAVAGVLLLGAAACGGGGGGGDQLTAEEYATELNSICEDFNTTQEEIGTPQSIDDVAEFGQQVLAAFDDAISQVEALEAPDELADTADEFVAKGQEQRDLLADVVEAAEAGDAAEVTELSQQGSQLDTESDALAEQLGAEACKE